MAMIPESPSTRACITCSDCRDRIPLAQMGEHVCGSWPRDATTDARVQGGFTSRLEAMSASKDSVRRGALPARIDTSPSTTFGPRARRTAASPCLTPSSSSRSFDRSPASHSPTCSSSDLSKSTSHSSGLSRSSSTTSDSSLASYNSPSPLSARLPFFDKYNKVYGDGNSSPGHAPKISLSASSSSSSSGSRSREVFQRNAPLQRSPAGNFSYERYGQVDTDNSRAQFEKSRPPAQSGLCAGDTIDRPRSAGASGESIGRAFLQSSPLVPDDPHFEGSALAYRIDEPPPSSRGRGSDALADLLEDLSMETIEMRSGLLDAYYFDSNDHERDTSRTPRASAQQPTPSSGEIRTSRSREPLHSPNPSGPPVPAAPARSRGQMVFTMCRTCRKQISTSASVERDGGRFCGPCYADRYLPKCRKCKLAIEGRAIGSGDGKVKGKFHVACFNCFACSAPFPRKEFYVFDERPYCAHDYHRLAGSLCTKCDRGIEGPCVSIDRDLGGHRYHPSCFTCSHTSCTVLLPEHHWIVDGQPYCERHAERRQTQGRRAEKRKTLVRPFARR